MPALPIRAEFTVHRLNERGLAAAETVSQILSDALTLLEAAAGADGREMAIVRTKLQEAGFFAKRALAVKPENQITHEQRFPMAGWPGIGSKENG